MQDITKQTHFVRYQASLEVECLLDLNDKNIAGYQRDLMKMRADHATSLHCDIFTIITNKHSSHRILSQTLLWSGPMRGGRSALKIILKTNNCTRYKKSRIFRTKSNIVLLVSVTLIFSYYEILEMLPLDYN